VTVPTERLEILADRYRRSRSEAIVVLREEYLSVIEELLVSRLSPQIYNNEQPPPFMGEWGPPVEVG
jgi:hypothetical protein